MLSNTLTGLLSGQVSYAIGGTPTASGLLLTVTDNGDGTATLTWTAFPKAIEDLPSADNYRVLVNGAFVTDIAIVTPQTLTYDHTVNDPSTPYTFQVKLLRYDDDLEDYVEVGQETNIVSKTITGDSDAAAYDARLVSASKTPSASEKLANATWAKALRDAGLTSDKVELMLLGWANQSANLLRFFSGSATEVGTNSHAVATCVTTGASGAINPGLIPSSNGFAGFGYYKKSTSVGSGSRIDMGAGTTAVGVVYNIANFNGQAVACYGGPQTTQQVTTTGQTLPGLYSMVRSSATTQSFARVTSSGTTVLTASGISGTTGAPSHAPLLGGLNSTGTYSNYSNADYSLMFYVKQYLTATERDDFHDIIIAWLLDLGWIT
jgi:hypothetical protein